MSSPELGVRRSRRAAVAKSYAEVEEDDDYTAEVSTYEVSSPRATGGSRKRRSASSAAGSGEDDDGGWQPGEDKENLDVNYVTNKRQRQAPPRRARAGGRGDEDEPGAAHTAELQDDAAVDVLQDGEGQPQAPLTLEELLDDSDIPVELQRDAEAEEKQRDADGGVVTEVYLENFMVHEVAAAHSGSTQQRTYCGLCSLAPLVLCSPCVLELHLPPQSSRDIHSRTQRKSA
jgi:hypothetical protein